MIFKRSLLSTSIALFGLGLTSQYSAAAELEEVIVMAQKRAESMQDVPVQVSTVSGDSIEKLAIVDAADIALLAPTLNFDSADEARLFNFSIRGIGTRSFSIGVEPSVSTVVDGVVLTRIGNAFDTLGDIEQVEVLAGPQGTLFGKNSSAGVVNIRTKAPNTEEFEGKFNVTAAQDNERSFNLSLTGPLTDSLAYRLFLFDRSNDGIARNLFDGTDENGVEASGGKFKLLWDASNDLSVLFSADYSEKLSNCCAMAPHTTDGGQYGTGGTARYDLVTGDYDPVNGYAVSTPEWLGIEPDKFGKYIKSDVDQVSKQRGFGGSVEVNYNLPSGHTLTSITAYREWRDYATRDRDSTHAQLSGLSPQEVAWMMGTTAFGMEATNAEIQSAVDALAEISYNPIGFMTNADGTIGTNNSLEFNETFSQEVRLASDIGEKFDYILGFYYGDQHVERDLTIAGKMNRIAGAVPHRISNIDPQTGVVTCTDPSCYMFGDTITWVETRNASVFAHGNYHLTDDFTLFAGFRYISEKTEWDMEDAVGPYGNHFSFARLIESVPYLDQLAAANDAATLNAITGLSIADYNADSGVAAARQALAAVDGVGSRGGQATLDFNTKYDITKTIYKLGAQYHINENLMVYASYGTGYKSPAVNADIFIFDSLGDVEDAPTPPEESSGFEIGLKGSFDSWRFDLTYYDTDIENLHTDGSATGGGSRAVGRLIAGDVNTSGVEGNFTWAATDSLTLSGGFSFGEAVIDDPDVTVGGVSADGTTILLAPDTKYNVSADYEFELGEYVADIYWTYTYTDKTFYGFGENQPRDDFAISNLAMNISNRDDTWKASFFVKNLFDEEYNSSLRSLSSTQGGGAMHTVGRDLERYYGVSFTQKF